MPVQPQGAAVNIVKPGESGEQKARVRAQRAQPTHAGVRFRFETHDDRALRRIGLENKTFNTFRPHIQHQPHIRETLITHQNPIQNALKIHRCAQGRAAARRRSDPEQVFSVHERALNHDLQQSFRAVRTGNLCAEFQPVANEHPRRLRGQQTPIRRQFSTGLERHVFAGQPQTVELHRAVFRDPRLQGGGGRLAGGFVPQPRRQGDGRVL